MTTIYPAISHAQTAADLGLSYFFASQAFDLQLVEKLDVAGLGIVPLVAIVGGQGSATVRRPFGEDIGFANAMTAAATESSPATMVDLDVGYSSITVAERTLGTEITYSQQVYGLDGATPLTVPGLLAMMPGTWVKTLRSLVCTSGASISASVGSSAAALDVDTYLDLVAAYIQTDGASEMGAPAVMIDPVQLTQLLESARSEPAFQNSIADFRAIQGAQGRVRPDFMGLGMDLVATSDVTTNGGAYQGFAIQRGAIGYAVGDVARIAPNSLDRIVIPERGMLVQRLVDKAGQATDQIEARAWLGTGLGDSTVYFQYRLLSTT